VATTTAVPPIDGRCDPRFVPVRDAFVTNFTERGDVGAAIALVLGGRCVVDLWGGWSDAAREHPWQHDTLVNVFSVTKALTTLCVLQAVERGLLALDEAVARCWPEFATAGKDSITLAQILSHRAGVTGVRAPLPDDAMLDPSQVTRALAAEAPWWEPGGDVGYHVNTFGLLLAELLRRVGGVTLGTWLRTEIAGPLDADVHVGLPPAEHARVATFLWPADIAPPPRPAAPGDPLMRWCAYWNPRGLSGGSGWVNTAAWRRAELPSSNGHATARGVARVYQALARGGTVDGVRILSEDLLGAATREHAAGIDRVLERPSRFGLGFQLTQPARPLGPNPRAFGHFGTGGSVGFCDPDADLAFAYVMNDFGPRWQNPRNRALIDAAYACL
jgi:CubicO group peptidase (beta-lactamase class C family)